MQAQAAEDVLEWLQPSGRRPEGCCCSTELSGGRGRLPEATGYRHRRTMHVPCMPTLTLADTSARQSDRHASFDHAHRDASGRCSTSASMCGSRAAQREQRSGDGEGRDCSSQVSNVTQRVTQGVTPVYMSNDDFWSLLMSNGLMSNGRVMAKIITLPPTAGSLSEIF